MVVSEQFCKIQRNLSVFSYPVLRTKERCNLRDVYIRIRHWGAAGDGESRGTRQATESAEWASPNGGGF